MPKHSPKKILVGLSGWVDSAVSAYLLKEAGYEVHAGFMINYITDDDSCPTRSDMKEAEAVAKYLDIPFHTFDFVKEYDERIVKIIYEWYASGITPNPDILCNNLVKFDIFLEEALAYGFDAIAMGHYTRILDKSSGQFGLLKWVDPEKDQSYFLSRLSQQQLSHALFPIGHLLKSEVRQIARKAGLPNADRKDSQGLCFIGKVGIQEFLSRRIEAKKGPIVDKNGKKLGEHDGIHLYTIGQRKGIMIGGGPALFVIHKNVDTDTLTVGTAEELALYSSKLLLKEWQFSDPISEISKFPLDCMAKIRYRQDDQSTHIQALGNGIFEAKFDTPQRAVAPGQFLVAYLGDELIGSGIITS